MKRLLIFPILLLLMTATSYAVIIGTDSDDFVDCLASVENVDPTKAFLMFEDTNSETEQLVSDLLDYADTFVGTPYRRGAKGPKAFDCSGFTSYIFRYFGVDLNASSSAQYTQGQSISKESIKPGDLLFFSGAAGGRSRVGHVAIAVDVDDSGTVTFIHAATSGGIKYDVYPDGGYYSNRYIGARRVIE